MKFSKKNNQRKTALHFSSSRQRATFLLKKSAITQLVRISMLGAGASLCANSLAATGVMAGGSFTLSSFITAFPAFFNPANTIPNTSTLSIFDDASVTVDAPLTNNGTVTNAGAMTNDNVIVNNGSLSNLTGATLTNNLTLSNYGNIYNYGTLTNSVGHYLYNYGTMTNNAGASLYNNGRLTNNTGGTFNNYGTLYNTGTLRNDGTLNNYGTLVMRSTGTTTGSGNYVFSSAGTLQLSVSSASAYSKVTTSGTIGLGGTLYIDVSGSNTLSNGNTLSGVIHADTGIGGTFDNITDNSYVFDFTASYTGNDVNLNVVATVPTVGAVAATGNSAALGAARALDGIFSSDPSGSIASLFTPLSTPQQVKNAVVQTLPLLTGATTRVAYGNMSSIQQVVQQRSDNLSGVRGLSSGDEIKDQNLWVKPFGSWSNQSNSNGADGYKSHIGGVVIGGDAAIASTQRAGLAFAYGQGNASSKSTVAQQSDTVAAFQLTGYGSTQLAEQAELSYHASVGMNQNDAKRDIPFAGGTAYADYDGYTVGFGARLARSYPINARADFIPALRADYAWVKERAYQETGSGAVTPLLLHVNGRTTDELVVGIDGGFKYKFDDATSVNALIGAGYNVLNSDSSITASYAGASGSAFVTHGVDADPWRGRFNLGISHRAARDMTIFANYDADFSEGYRNQTASLKLQKQF